MNGKACMHESTVPSTAQDCFFQQNQQVIFGLIFSAFHFIYDHAITYANQLYRTRDDYGGAPS